MAYTLSHIDTCCLDYFRGSDLPVASILVDENTTYGDIKEALLNINYSIDHIDNIDVDAYVHAVHELFSSITSLDRVPETLRNVGDMCDSMEWDLYMYFSIEEIKEVEDN